MIFQVLRKLLGPIAMHLLLALLVLAGMPGRAAVVAETRVGNFFADALTERLADAPRGLVQQRGPPVFEATIVPGSIVAPNSGARRIVLGENMDRVRARALAVLNKTGTPYPAVKDVVSGKLIDFPEGSLVRVPKADRVTCGATERGEFIAESYKRGYNTPSGGWEYYDLHHIKPREFGGTNAFENLTPVERTVEHQKLNRFWEKY
jgi:hypothetical protein